MFRRSSGLTAGHAIPFALVLALACSDGSGPGDGGNSTTGTIGGTVSAAGAGVSGATIALSGGATAQRTTTGSGAYQFDNLSPGAYTVTITLPEGFSLAQGEPAAKAATVTAGQTATVDWSAVADDNGGVTVVTAAGTSFTPQNVTIAVGETVRWVVNNGTHTVTPDNPGQTGGWTGTGQLSGGQQFQHTFTTAGTFDYHCIPHQSLGMTGTVTVQ